MFENIRADTMRALNKEEPGFQEINFFRLLGRNYGLQALVVYRFGRWLRDVGKHNFGWAVTAPLYPIYWALSVFVRKAYGIDLDQSANIAPGFYINHFGGIEVRNCRIGSCCNIQQHVKVGASETACSGAVIGEGVYIGAHAKICADVSVGDGATIGAGAVITQDIPSHCLVIGNPSRIAKWDYDNRELL